MSNYEDLLAEYDEELDITERNMRNEGLYADGCVWIRRDLPSNRKVCILAEEIGHHETSSGNILDQRNLNNSKQERLARKWAYEKLLPTERIGEAISKGYTTLWDMAEYLDVDEEFLRHCLVHYGILDISL